MTELIRTRINGRWDLLLPEHRAVRPQWDIANGGWETERLSDMHAAVTIALAELRIPHVLDVGAEEGDMPALYASWGARVTCVEPNPLVWPNIRAIFEGNGLDTPDWFVGFCGDESRLGLEDVDELDGWPVCANGPVIGDHGFCQLNERPDISATTIDSLRVLHGPFDMITIDVEGSELSVMRGAAACLSLDRPVVWIAIHPTFMRDQYGVDPGHLHDLMGRAGYVGRLLADDHEQHWRFDPLS